MKILSVELERIWTCLQKTKYEEWSVELERTWTYIWKTKYEDIVSWTRKTLNLPTKNKIWRYCQLNWKELEPTYNRRKKIWRYCDLNGKELEPIYEKQNMKILSVDLERTWTYLWKTKYVDNVSWTRKNLNLHMKKKVWRYCQLN